MAHPLVRSTCAACGVLARRTGSVCDACDAPLVPTALLPTPGDTHDTYWVAVRFSVQCRSCSFAAPLDHLAVEGSIDCAQCGVRQRFDTDSWGEALAFAHAVGDLAGPDPEGRAPHPGIWIGGDNPHQNLGQSETFGVFRQTGMHSVDGLEIPRSLRIEAAPGQPTCRACHVALKTTVTGEGRVETVCPRCQTTATYVLPKGATSVTAHAALLGVISDEHRTDRPRAQESSSGDARALSCPSCGGPLKLAPHDRLAHCEFCKTTCVIPARALVRDGQVPKPALWWQLFSGLSAKRRELLTETGEQRIGSIALPPVFAPTSLKTAPIGGAPGVYEAPAAPGLKIEQMLFTLGIGSLAVAIGYVVMGR